MLKALIISFVDSFAALGKNMVEFRKFLCCLLAKQTVYNHAQAWLFLLILFNDHASLVSNNNQ